MKSLATKLFAVLLCLGTSLSLAAQTTKITGVVTDENGEPLAGETGSILYKQLVMGNQYSVLLTEANGMQLFSCPLTVTPLSAIETPQTAIRLHPTVANPLQTIHCQSDQPASLTVYDVQGRQTEQLILPAGHSTFPAPAEAGLYLLLLHSLPSGKATTAKLIVIPN